MTLYSFPPIYYDHSLLVTFVVSSSTFTLLLNDGIPHSLILDLLSIVYLYSCFSSFVPQIYSLLLLYLAICSGNLTFMDCITWILLSSLDFQLRLANGIYFTRILEEGGALHLLLPFPSGLGVLSVAGLLSALASVRCPSSNSSSSQLESQLDIISFL